MAVLPFPVPERRVNCSRCLGRGFVRKACPPGGGGGGRGSGGGGGVGPAGGAPSRGGGGAGGVRGRLVSEGLSQRDERTYRPSQSSHAGHGCCQDAYRPSTVGVLLGANEGVRALVGTNEHGQALTVALRCRSWGCACCARKLRARNRAKALMGATGRVVFFTLTIDPSDGRYVAALGAFEGKGETAPSIRYGQWAWNRMTARGRARGWSFSYARGVGR